MSHPRRLALALALLMPLAALAAEKDDKDKEKGKEPPKWDVNAARGPGQEAAIDVRRRHLDERRRQPRRQGDRLRPAGRPLHDADRRRRGQARSPPASPGTSSRATRPDGKLHRLHQRPRRRRQHLGHGPRRQESAAGHEGDLPPAQQPGVDAGRRVHRGAQALHLAALGRRRRDLALPPQRRRRPADDQAAERPEGPRASRPSRPTAATSTTARTPRPDATFEYNKDPNTQIYVIQRLDRESGEIERVRHRAGRRHPADAVAGRQDRSPSCAACAARACSFVDGPRVGQRARRSTTASTATCRRPGRSTASIRAMAWTPDSKPQPGLLGRRQDPPRSTSRAASGRRHPVPRDARRARSPRRCASRSRSRPRRSHVKMLRWVAGLAAGRSGGLPGARPSMDPRPARRHAAPADHAERPLRVLPVLLARRHVDRLHDLGRRDAGRRARGLERRRRRARRDREARALRRAGVLARRRDDRLPRRSRAASCARPRWSQPTGIYRVPAAGGEARRWSRATARAAVRRRLATGSSCSTLRRRGQALAGFARARRQRRARRT